MSLPAACGKTTSVHNHRPDRSRVVRACLAEWGARVQVHDLPKSAPDTNPIEAVWWQRHEAVRRNPSCASMGGLDGPDLGVAQ